jgi:peptidoglycan-associated lipoprotein
MKLKTLLMLLAAVVLLFTVAGCKKKKPAPPTPPPPPPVVAAAKPAATVASFKAEPNAITRGESSTLSWDVANATSVTIDNGVGTVAPKGTYKVSPSSSTTYRLTAKGEGGDATASASVSVSAPTAPPPPPPPAKASLSDRVAKDLSDVFFDYDKSDVREDARATLQRSAEAIKAILAEFPSAALSLEGNCDERGSAEYNMGLGERRATNVKKFLTEIGVSADRLKTISFGKEKQVCSEENESCWQKNRRVHFSGVE